MIIKGNFIFTPTFGELEVKKQSYLLVQAGIVVGFFETLTQAQQAAGSTDAERASGRDTCAEEVIDYGEALIIPAFNDLHIHAPQMINRGVGFDKELLPWLETYTFPVEGRYADIDFAERAYKLFLNRMWANGTMRFSAFGTIHKEATWKLMQMTEACGLGGLIGKVNMDRNAPDYLCEDTERSLADTEELIIKSREELKHVGFIVTPRFVPSTTTELMRGLGRLTEQYHLPVQSHLSENKSEIEWVGALHPECGSYSEVYHYYGLMPAGQTLMAHCIHLSEEEKDLLQERHVMLTHCAQSNMDLSSGIMPLRSDLERGLDCCIASDVAGSHTAAMNRHLSATVELSKVNQMFHPEEKSLSLAEAFYLATKKSGSFFGKVGSFERGYAFDALVIETDEMGPDFPRTPFEKLEQYAYDGDDRNILVRYCRGKIVEKPFSV